MVEIVEIEWRTEMKISTRGRYGVRLMLELAAHYGKQTVTLKQISKSQCISEKYLWHLVPPLKAAGLLSSGRGAHGGYSLAKSPSKITLKDIVTAAEGPLFPTICAGNPSSCKRSPLCASRDIWEEIGKKVGQILSSVTLEELMQRQNNKAKKTTGMYYI
jgi:Rrf2 family protein